MVTMEDLLAFDEEKEEEPEKVEKTQTFDVNYAVSALKQIQASNGDKMFELVDNFLRKGFWHNENEPFCMGFNFSDNQE